MSNQIMQPLTMEERKVHEDRLRARANELDQDPEYLEYIRQRDERQREFNELMESEEESDESESESESEEEDDEPLISNEELEEYQAQFNNIILGTPEHIEYMNQYGRAESDESDEYEEYEAAGITPTGDK